MALPILKSPKYDIRLPSSGNVVEYRPFLVKEEKILLIAQESGSSRDMIRAMKDIVKACTFGKIDANILTSYDLEYLFLKLRAKSVGESTNVKIKCNECKNYESVEINIDEVNIPNVSKDDTNIMLDDNIGIKMRHIRVRDLANITDDKKEKGEQIEETIIASIEAIYDENGVYPTDEASKSELHTFVNSLNRSQIKKIEEYIEQTPKIKLDVDFKCSKCEHDITVTLEGVQSFFG